MRSVRTEIYIINLKASSAYFFNSLYSTVAFSYCHSRRVTDVQGGACKAYQRATTAWTIGGPHARQNRSGIHKLIRNTGSKSGSEERRSSHCDMDGDWTHGGGEATHAGQLTSCTGILTRYTIHTNVRECF